MNRLNYFNPYDSKAGSHEDRLDKGLSRLNDSNKHDYKAILKLDLLLQLCDKLSQAPIGGR